MVPVKPEHLLSCTVGTKPRESALKPPLVPAMRRT
jgi:hypothetical protein